MSKLTFASVISEIQQSDIFMTVKARICEAPQANLNGARVTEAFIDEIVSNERYVGLPLYADKKALISGNYTRLGHLYDTKTGEFHSTQIGSFYKFEKQVNGENCYLVGYARIPKRNKKLSKAISELFADNALKFSFELSVGEYEELDDDTILIDASDNNYLEGTAIVTYPACEDAVALELVAQKADETRKGDEEMAEVENKAEVVETEATQPELAEEKKAEETAETEEAACKDKKENSEEEETACKDKKENSEEETACKDKKEQAEETAAVVTREYHDETHVQTAYDTETGKEVRQAVTISTESCDVQEGTLVEAVDGVHVAEVKENDPVLAPETTAPPVTQEQTQETNPVTPQEPQEPANPSTEPANENPENTNPDNPGDNPPEVVAGEQKTTEQMIAELANIINELKSEIAELKERKQEAKTVTADINPFMDTLKTESKYSLLEKDEKVSSYSLLSK